MTGFCLLTASVDSADFEKFEKNLFLISYFPVIERQRENVVRKYRGLHTTEEAYKIIDAFSQEFKRVGIDNYAFNISSRSLLGECQEHLKMGCIEVSDRQECFCAT